jgi:predicted transcriptional regulator
MSVEAAEKTDPAQVEQLKVIEKRWSKPLTKAGWTALPNTILDKQVVLGLTPLDVNILMQIAKYWWSAENAPFPSIDTIAAAIDVTPRTVQRRIARMEKAKLIERNKRYYAQGGQKSNAYTFKGLIARCTPFAEEAVKERERKKATARANARRRQPLTVVK